MLKSSPIRISIPGDFWDSHIYAGWLYLFGSDKSLRKIEWEFLIGRQTALAGKMIVVNAVLIDSSFFYRAESRLFLKDEKVHARVNELIDELKGLTVEVNNLDRYPRAHRKDSDSPFPELHTDFEIYHRRMYAGMPEGLYRANSSIDGDDDSSKLWDSPIYAVKASASYGSIAIAAADEGLWEFDIREQAKGRITKNPLTVTTQKFCTACDWADQSIYGWSGSSSGFLASYYTEKAVGENKVNRIFDRTIESQDLYDFPEEGGPVAFWGSHDRAYALKGDELEILDYDPKLLSRQKKIAREAATTPVHQSLLLEPVMTSGGESNLVKRPKRVKLDKITGATKRPVAVATAPFGTVMQFGNTLFVFRSDGETETIEGEIVSWRTFPRSLNYANQLHVVFEDRIDIYAFVHDFFVNQSEKLFGYGVRKQ